jgi:hypothetical protein
MVRKMASRQKTQKHHKTQRSSQNRQESWCLRRSHPVGGVVKKWKMFSMARTEDEKETRDTDTHLADKQAQAQRVRKASQLTSPTNKQ